MKDGKRSLGKFGERTRTFFTLHGKKFFPLFSVLFIGLLLGITIYKFAYDRPFFRSYIIANDVDKIVEILADIDKRCNILSIDSENNKIDFLTVKDFTGSEIGPLNLAYPRQWPGAYVGDNPTLQGKLYELVRGRDGWYVVPGKGVSLPAGRVMGKDVVITPKVNVDALLRDGGKLNFKGKPFARKLDFIIGDWDASSQKANQLQKIDVAIEEFSSALPYTQNDVGF